MKQIIFPLLCVFLSIQTHAQKTEKLPEVLISARKYDYTILHAYYRSYQYDNNQLLYFADGMVDYFVPNKGKRLRFCVHEHRTYINKDLYDSLKLYKSCILVKSYGPVHFLASEHYPKDEDKLIHKEIDGNILKVEYDCLAPDTLKKYNIFGNKIRTTQSGVSEILQSKDTTNQWSRTDMKRYTSTSEVAFKRKCDKDYIDTKTKTDIYVLSKERITKKEKRKYKVTKDYGLVEGFDVGDRQWLDFAKHDIPAVPKHIEKMFGKELQIKYIR